MKTQDELAQEIGRNLQGVGAYYKDTQIKDFLNRAYQDIWDRRNWPALKEVAQITVTAGSTSFILPKRFCAALRCYQGSVNSLRILELEGFQDANFGLAQQSFPVVDTAPSGQIEIAVQPSTPQSPKLVSSASDSSVVLLKGRDTSGEQIQELVTLAGTVPVAATLTYSVIDSISKAGNTLGTIALLSNDETQGYATLGQYERVPQYARYILANSQTTDFVITAVVKRRFSPFLHTHDVPFMEVDAALIAGAEYRGWKEHRQFDAAEQVRQEFENQIRKLIIREFELDGAEDLIGITERA